MSEAPYFSIIIPVLNEAARLPGLLSMFAGQTFQDFELIIVDAKSEDDSIRMLKSFTASFPLRVLSSEKRNAGFQRNLGAKSASANNLLFFDADTVITDDFLAAFKLQLEKYHPDFASTRFVASTRNIFDRALAYFASVSMFVLARWNFPFMSASQLFFRREAYDKMGGFDTSVLISDDHELVQRAARLGFGGRLFFNPVHTFSFRRFEREGRLKVLAKYCKALCFMIVKGPIRTPIYEYKMGGKT